LNHVNLSKADCTKWKIDLDSSNDPSLRRKFIKWKAENFTNFSSLVESLMHPISKLRLESHVAVIRLKELPVKFRVISAEPVLIESLRDPHRQTILNFILSNQTDELEYVCCEAVFEVNSIDTAYRTCFFEGYHLGEYSELPDIQERASVENGRRAEIIQMLKKEL
jgi:hypothetical protein